MAKRTLSDKSADYVRRSLKVYVGPAAWEAFEHLGKAQGITRNMAIKRVIDEMAPQVREVAEAIIEAKAGRWGQARERMAGTIAQAILELGDKR